MCDDRGVARVFESLGESTPDEWYVTLVLALDDDGRFELRDERTCYWGAATLRASGRWRDEAGSFALVVEVSDHPAWAAGTTIAAARNDGAVLIDGTKLYPR